MLEASCFRKIKDCEEDSLGRVGSRKLPHNTKIMGSKVILTTGANRGIGFSIVQALAQRSSGLVLLVASRSKVNANKAISRLQELGLKANFQPIELDVTNDDSIKAAVDEVKAKYGKLDGKKVR